MKSLDDVGEVDDGQPTCPVCHTPVVRYGLEAKRYDPLDDEGDEHLPPSVILEQFCTWDHVRQWTQTEPDWPAPDELSAPWGCVILALIALALACALIVVGIVTIIQWI